MASLLSNTLEKTIAAVVGVAAVAGAVKFYGDGKDAPDTFVMDTTTAQTEEPVAEELAVEEPVTEEVAVEEPVTEELAAVEEPTEATTAEISDVSTSEPPRFDDTATMTLTADPDIVRYGEPTTLLVSGKATPGDEILVMNGEEKIISGLADTNGEYALIKDFEVPKEGAQIRVGRRLDSGEIVYAEAVTSLLPTEEELANVKMTEDALKITGGNPEALSLTSASYEDTGPVTFEGTAEPGETVQLFIDGKLVSEIVAEEGQWSTDVEIDPSEEHALRIATASGYQLDETFTRTPEPTGSEETTKSVVVGSTTYTVLKGDTLWTIAQNELGSATRYHEVYTKNASMISDPNVIYPGQVLTLP